MHHPLLVLLLLLIRPSTSTPQTSTYIGSVATHLCLTAGSDSSLQLSTCTPNLLSQLFDYWPSTGVLKTNGKCVDATFSTLKLQPCTNELVQSWTFGPDGYIKSRSQPTNCVGQGVQTTQLILEPCATSLTWGVSPTAPFQLAGPPPLLPVSLPQQQMPVPESDALNAALCACLEDKQGGACNEAARAACQTGRLPSTSCQQSFGHGRHDRITDDILRLIDNGRRCSSLQQQPPQAPPDKQYLCACSQPGPRCEAAVRAGCLVGHLPKGDCDASLARDGTLLGLSDHLTRMVAAQCGGKELLPAVAAKPSKTIPALCVCLDDPEAQACLDAMRHACDARQLPADDCAALKQAKYLGGVTRHALRAVGHGAACPLHRAMTMTNRGCHCLQSWRPSVGAKALTFPDNCADPGGVRGFPWCRTYPHEACAGVEGDTTWDRCDSPLPPRMHEDNDHYLCVCLEASDAVCVAAVRAACQAGHLPASACEASLSRQQHEQVSDEVVKLIQQGRRCSGFDPSSLGSSTFCGKGRPNDKGCDCFKGFDGKTCDRCEPGFVGFPDCRPAKACLAPCTHGLVCDLFEGVCVLPPSTNDWTVGQVIIYLLLIFGLAYAAIVILQKWRASRVIAYLPLNKKDVEQGGDVDNDVDFVPSPNQPSPIKTERNGLAV